MPRALVLLHKHIVKGAIHLGKAAWCEYPFRIQLGALAFQFCGDGRWCQAVQIKMCQTEGTVPATLRNLALMAVGSFSASAAAVAALPGCCWIHCSRGTGQSRLQCPCLPHL